MVDVPFNDVLETILECLNAGQHEEALVLCYRAKEAFTDAEDIRLIDEAMALIECALYQLKGGSMH